jgi:hypothetical protein
LKNLRILKEIQAMKEEAKRVNAAREEKLRKLGLLKERVVA